MGENWTRTDPAEANFASVGTASEISGNIKFGGLKAATFGQERGPWRSAGITFVAADSSLSYRKNSHSVDTFARLPLTQIFSIVK